MTISAVREGTHNTITLKVYSGLSHGMCTVNKGQINSDLLTFIKA